MLYKYTFLGKNYVSIEDLAVGLSKNYGDAINFIFTDTFINQIDDYYLRGRIQTEMRRCKYVESVFTMIIYLLNPGLGLCVRGRFFRTLQELANYMHVTSGNKDLSVIHLFLDNCITHTIGNDPLQTQEFKDNIVYIEDNIEDDAIYEYFIDLFDIKFKREDAHGLTMFDYYLSTISSSASRLDSYLSLVSDPGFKSALFKTFGLKQVLEIYNQKNAPFLIIKLIDEHTKLDIVQFLDMGITNWLLKNYKNYNFSFATRKVKALLKQCAKESKKVMSVDERVKFNEKVYTYYRSFINLYDCHEIVEKSEEYRLDIYYNKNRGCIKYYQDIGLSFDYNTYKINLQTYSKENVKKIMKHSLSEIDVYNNNDAMLLAKDKMRPINYLKNLNSRIFVSTLFLLMSLAAFGLIAYLAYIKSSLFGKNEYFASIVAIVSSFVFSFISIRRLKGSRRILRREFLTRDDAYYEEAKENKTLGYKKAYRKNTLLFLLESIAFGLTLTFVAYATAFLGANQVTKYFMYSFAAMGGLGFLFGLLFKKQTYCNLFLVVLAAIVMVLTLLI